MNWHRLQNIKERTLWNSALSRNSTTLSGCLNWDEGFFESHWPKLSNYVGWKLITFQIVPKFFPSVVLISFEEKRVRGKERTLMQKVGLLQLYKPFMCESKYSFDVKNTTLEGYSWIGATEHKRENTQEFGSLFNYYSPFNEIWTETEISLRNHWTQSTSHY